MKKYLIIIKGDWNDADYVYNHVHTDDESIVELAKDARLYMNKSEDRHNNDFIQKFSNEYEANEDDFDEDNIYDDEGELLFDKDELTHKLQDSLMNQYGQKVFDSLRWLAGNVPWGYEQDIHSVKDISIYEINKKI